MMNALEILDLALSEDAPQGDLTCLALKESAPNLNESTAAYVVAKQDLVFSGMDFVKALKDLHQKNSLLTQELQVETFFKNSDSVLKGQKALGVFGNCADILLIERSLLNVLGHLCGIATLTQSFVKEVAHTSCKILDTRKTLPLYRSFEKQAVVDGGGQNHRMSLSDAVMLKENHLKSLPLGLVHTVNKIRETYPKTHITVEVKNISEALQASKTSVDQILLDNMSEDELRACLEIIPKHIKTEASGNMTLDRVSRIAEMGVDFISVGALTHSAVCADISLLLE